MIAKANRSNAEYITRCDILTLALNIDKYHICKLPLLARQRRVSTLQPSNAGRERSERIGGAGGSVAKAAGDWVPEGV